MRKYVLNSFIFLITTGIFFTLTTTGCNVGLGSAVDAEPPKIEITYPPKGAIIRDWFILAGTCSDDIGVSKVQVQFENQSTLEKSAVMEASISEDGSSWSITLNQKDKKQNYPFADGTYEITVTASDKAYSSQDKLSVIIDNHAPVLLLSSPQKLVTDTSASTYGRNVKLAGDIADDNKVSSLNIILRDWTNGTLSKEDEPISITVEDFSQMSSDSPLLVAKYSTLEELSLLEKQIQNETDAEKKSSLTETLANYRALRQNYLRLYYNTPALTYEAEDIASDAYTDKTFLCTLTVSDNAILYQKKGDTGSGEGNTTKEFYINTSEFSKQLMSAKTFSLTATKLKNLLKGSSSYTQSEDEEILSTLRSLSCTVSSESISETNALKIQINPDNVPHWKITGYETGLTESGEPINSSAKTANKGYRITAKTASLNVNMSAGFDNSRIDASSVEINMYCMGSDPEKLTKDEYSRQTILKKGAWDAEAALRQDYVIPLDDEESQLSLESNYYYQVEVTGSDEDENKLVPENPQGYGILVYSGYNAPSVSFQNPDITVSGKNIQNVDFVIQGQIITDDLALAQDSPVTITSLKRTDTALGTEEELSLAPELYTVTAEGTKPNFTYSIKFDHTKSSSLIPEAQGRYKYVASVCVIDDKQDRTDERYTFYVDTKEPAIKITTSQSAFVKDAIQMELNVSDSSGIQDVSYSLYTSDDTGFENPIQFFPCTAYSNGNAALAQNQTASVSIGESESSAITIYLSGANDSTFTDAKKIILRVKASDKTTDGSTKQADTLYANTAYAESTAFTVDKKAPEYYTDNTFVEQIGGKNFSEENWYNTTTLPVVGYWNESGSGVNEVSASIGTGTLAKVSTFGTTAVSGKTGIEKFNTTLSGFEEGSNTVTLTATDKVGNTSTTVLRKIKIDTNAPTISDESGNTLLTSGTITGSFTFSAQDANTLSAQGNNRSGIKSASVQIGSYKIESGNETYGTLTQNEGTYTVTPNDALITALIGGSTSFTKTFNVTASVTDNAGNSSASAIIGSISVDCLSPTLTVTSHKANDVVNKTFTLQGSASDSSEIAKITLWQQRGESAPAQSNAPLATLTDTDGYDQTTGTWSVNIDSTKFYNGNETQKHSFLIAAEDKAGNQSTCTLTLVIDQKTDRPLIKLTNLEARSGSSIKSTAVQGTLSDDDGDVKGLWIIEQDNFEEGTFPSLTSNNSWKKVPVESGTGSWSFDTDEGPQSYFFYAIDGAGNSFHSKASERLSAILVQGKTEANSSEDYSSSAAHGISFTSDLTPPEVTQIVFTHGTSAKSDDNWGSAVNVFGEGDKYLYLKVSVNEAVGMKKNGSEFKAPVVKFASTEVPVSIIGTVENEGSAYTYYLSKIDLSALSLSQGQISVRVIAEDASGQTGQSNANIIWDTSAPTIKIISPTTNVSDAVTTSITVKGLMQDTYASLNSLYYLIPKAGESYTGKESEGWNEINASTSWEIKFASGAADSSDSLLYYVVAKSGNDFVYDISKTDTENVYKVPIYFKTVDSVGNTGVTKDQYVLVDPEGGKPKAWITSPENNATTSGLVTLYGGSSDNVSVRDVQVQIDADNDGYFNSSDYTVLSGSTWSGTAVQAALVTESRTGIADDWGITCVGTNSWKIAVDTDKIAENAGKKTLRVRVRAWDDENYTREWTSPISITIDNTAPVIKNVKLVQYGSGNTSGSPVTEREYVSGMYISHTSVLGKGEWYLVADVSDNESVSSISFTDLGSSGSSVSIPLAAKPIEPNAKSYSVNIPIDTSRTGTINSVMKAQDANSGSATQSLVINIDSTPPSLYNTSNTESTSVGNALRLKSRSNVIGSESTSATVLNNNGWFTFGDTVKEDGSGLSSIAFYFKRTGTSGTRIYNPMHGEENRTEVYANKDAATSALGSNDASTVCYINSDNLASLYISGATRSTEDSLTSAHIVGNKNIHTGGLVKIAGVYSRITSVSLEEGKITFTPTASKSFTEAELIYAQVVDHQLSESLDDDGITVVNDDGDLMVETINTLGASYQWTASINSANIPDGPVTICVVAMDSAGNITSGSISTKVENNRPRIAKVLLGTDLNGNGKYDYRGNGILTTDQTSENHLSSEEISAMKGNSRGEFSYFSALSQMNVSQTSVAIGSQSFKVVSGLAIVPEIVGGNNGIGYVMSAKQNSPSLAVQTGSVTPLMKKETFLDSVNNLNDTYTLSNEVNEYGAINLTGDTVNGSGTYYYNFTFWDKTEETTQGTNSQWATLSVPVTLMTTESNAPSPKIKPFYWNSATDNSVYINNAISGHIELEDDLAGSEIPSVTVSSVALGSDDPKVSGKIKIEGTVHDDVRLSSLSLSVFGGASAVVGNYANGIWTAAPDFPAGVVSFTATDEDISQNGHTANFTIVVDTEAFSVGLDKSIKITATDWKNNSSSAGSTQTTAATNTDCYKMDVVPYVTEIVTHLSAFNGTSHSTFARTAKGHYPVAEGETVALNGYNLGTNIATITLTGQNSNALTLENGTISGEPYVNTFTLTPTESGKTGAVSGLLEVSVAGIPALNNKNNNSAKGKFKVATESGYSLYKNYYNCMPNNANNYLLDDNLYLDVWQFKNAVEPVNGSAEYVTMKINPKTGLPGFSFANSILYYNMPAHISDQPQNYFGANNTITGELVSTLPVGMNYGGFSQNTFTWDSYGYSYGVAMCTDTSKNKESAFFQFFSREGPIPVGDMDQNMNYNNSANASRLDSSSVQIKAGDSGWVTNINRVLSPAMDTFYSDSENEPTSSNPVYVYLAYYDAAAQQIRFRWGTVGNYTDNIDGKSNGTSGSSALGYGLDDIVDSKYTGFAQRGKSDTSARPSEVSDSLVKYSANKGVQIVAANGISDAISYYSSSTGFNSNNYRPGQYVALSVAKKDATTPVPIVTWYDSVNRKLVMAYNENPTTSINWTSRVIDASGGLNVKTAVDGDGGIHFAYYDSINGSNLRYAYLASYDSAEDALICDVDNYGAVGAKCSIDIVSDGTHWVPYISYQNNGYLGTPISTKIAYRTDFTSDSIEGSDSSDFITGKWEISIIPTNSIPKDDLVSIGFWKNSNGVAREFTNNVCWKSSDTGVGETTINGTLNVCSPTKVYGNNTANPILAYGIDTGAIEMAQKK